MLTAWTRVVTLAVPGAALDERLAVGDSRHLRRLRDAVDVAAERDHGAPGAPARYPAAGDAGHAELDVEALRLEELRDVALGLELLESELGEAVQAVDHALYEDAAVVDAGARFFLQPLELQPLEPGNDLVGRGPVLGRRGGRRDDGGGSHEGCRGKGRAEQGGVHGSLLTGVSARPLKHSIRPRRPRLRTRRPRRRTIERRAPRPQRAGAGEGPTAGRPAWTCRWRFCTVLAPVRYDPDNLRGDLLGGGHGGGRDAAGRAGLRRGVGGGAGSPVCTAPSQPASSPRRWGARRA